eukprot:g4278.t1
MNRGWLIWMGVLVAVLAVMLSGSTSAMAEMMDPDLSETDGAPQWKAEKGGGSGDNDDDDEEEKDSDDVGEEEDGLGEEDLDEELLGLEPGTRLSDLSEEEIAEIVAEHKAELKARENPDTCEALIQAIQRRNVDALRRVMKNETIQTLLVTCRTEDESKESVLHEAAWNCHPPLFKELLELEDVVASLLNATDERMETPLHLAAWNCEQSLQCLRLLIGAGADLSKKNVAGETALTWVEKTMHYDCMDVLRDPETVAKEVAEEVEKERELREHPICKLLEDRDLHLSEFYEKLLTLGIQTGEDVRQVTEEQMKEIGLWDDSTAKHVFFVKQDEFKKVWLIEQIEARQRAADRAANEALEGSEDDEEEEPGEVDADTQMERGVEPPDVQSEQDRRFLVNTPDPNRPARAEL